MSNYGQDKPRGRRPGYQHTPDEKRRISYGGMKKKIKGFAYAGPDYGDEE